MTDRLLNGEIVPFTEEEEAAYAVMQANPPVPLEIPMWKALTLMRLTPLGEGTMYSAVLMFIDAIPDAVQRDLANILLGFAPNLRRDAPLVAAAQAFLGLADSQIDDLFIQGDLIGA